MGIDAVFQSQSSLFSPTLALHPGQWWVHGRMGAGSCILCTWASQYKWQEHLRFFCYMAVGSVLRL